VNYIIPLNDNIHLFNCKFVLNLLYFTFISLCSTPQAMIYSILCIHFTINLILLILYYMYHNIIILVLILSDKNVYVFSTFFDDDYDIVMPIVFL
jgi:hypothetical protein